MNQKIYDFDNMNKTELKSALSDLYVEAGIMFDMIKYADNIFSTLKEWSTWSSAQTDNIGYARAQEDVKKILAGKEWIK